MRKENRGRENRSEIGKEWVFGWGGRGGGGVGGRENGGWGVCPWATFKRKQFSPQFGEKSGDKRGEGVLMMGNYPFALPLFIYLFIFYLLLFVLPGMLLCHIGWLVLFCFLYIYIYIKQKLFYFILLFFLLLDILLVLLVCSN